MGCWHMFIGEEVEVFWKKNGPKIERLVYLGAGENNNGIKDKVGIVISEGSKGVVN